MTWFQKPPLGTPLDWSNPLNKGLMMDLAMNEGHGDVVRDLSLYGNHGTLNDFAFPPTVASGWNPGRNGVGLNFDGTNDYVDCGDIDYTGFTDLTISMWEKTNIIPVNHNILIANAQPNTANGFAITHYRSGRFYFYHGLKTSYTPSAIPAGAWHHIAFVIKQGDTIQGFVNGVGYNIEDVSGLGHTIDNGAAHTFIGKGATGTAFPHNGSIDQTRILNRTWSAKECMDYAINPWQVYLDEDD